MRKQNQKRNWVKRAVLGGALASVLGLLVVAAVATGLGSKPVASSAETPAYISAAPLSGVPAEKLSSEELQSSSSSSSEELNSEELQGSSSSRSEELQGLSPTSSEELPNSSSASSETVMPARTPPEGSPAAATVGAEDKLIVRFLDVGQGDCAIISCEGHHMLIDGGPSSASQKVFTVLKNLGIDYLDYIVATHADADHVGGISAALNAAECGVCYCSVEVSDTRTFESMTRYVRKSGSPFVVPEIPTVLDLGGATLSIIGPVQAFPDSDNNGSLICRIDYGETSFLFMGDAEEEAETSLVRSGVDVHADVVKIGHHGSSHSTTSALLDAVSPSAAVISVGVDNPYGHPTERVLNLLDRKSIETYRTDIDGDVIAVSDGENISIRTTHAAINE